MCVFINDPIMIANYDNRGMRYLKVWVTVLIISLITGGVRNFLYQCTPGSQQDCYLKGGRRKKNDFFPRLV
jgi:hypothetical protein